jgi:signal transduction histidine kinase
LSNMSHEIRTPMNAIIGSQRWYLKQIWLRNKRISKCYKMSGDALIVQWHFRFSKSRCR